MGKSSYLYISLIVVFSVTGCIKETYNMNMLSEQDAYFTNTGYFCSKRAMLPSATW